MWAPPLSSLPLLTLAGFREWPLKDDGNKHFAAIFLDEGRAAGLHLFKDRNCLVFAQGAFHSSRALCAKVLVCGGTFWAAGVPNARMKAGSVKDGRCAIAATARRMSLSFTS